MPVPEQPQRRAADERLAALEAEVREWGRMTREIRDWLIGEPESSALGRQLLARAKANRSDIIEHDHRIDSLENWRAEWRGSWRLITVVGTVLGILGSVFGIAGFFGHP